MIWLWLAGCTGDGERVRAPDDAETGRVHDLEILASCDVQDGNELRLVCQVDLPTAGSATVSIWPEDNSEPPRVYSSEASDLDHEIVVWDLVGDTTYSWQVASDTTDGPTGTVRTGIAPPGIALPVQILTSGPSSIDRLLLPWSCGGDGMLTVIDSKGVLRWYGGSFSPISLNGISVSERGFLVLSGRSRLQEIARDGSELRSLGDGDFPQPVHHDLAAVGDQVFVLKAEVQSYPDGLDYVVDGLFSVAEAGEVTPVWSVGDALDPQGLVEPLGSYWTSTYGDAIDFGHANAIDVDDRGMWLVSFKHLDTVMAVVGDPASPQYGEVAWTLVGGAFTGAPDPLELISTVGINAAFEYQHHAHWTDAGIMLVDNGRIGPSRVLDLVIDEEAGTADVVAEYGLGVHCPIQSSGYRLDDGTLVATCSANRHVYEFDPDGTLRREISIVCTSPSALTSALVKAIPVSL